MEKKFILALSLSFSLFTVAIASATVISSTPNTTLSARMGVNNIADWDTNGNSMAGMYITATFSDTTSSSGTWANGSGASGTGWSLTLETLNGYNASTFSPATLWVLTNTNTTSSLKSLVINGLGQNGSGGDTVFDIITTDPLNSTPGSAQGRPITEPSSSDPYHVAIYAPSFWTNTYLPAAQADSLINVNVGYSNAIYVGSNPASYVGDLFATLTVGFADGLSGTSGTNRYVFAIDTDNVNSPVPEPATFLLFGAGIAGFGSMLRRRKK